MPRKLSWKFLKCSRIFFQRKCCRAILDEEVIAIINSNNRDGQARSLIYPAKKCYIPNNYIIDTRNFRILKYN